MLTGKLQTFLQRFHQIDHIGRAAGIHSHNLLSMNLLRNGFLQPCLVFIPICLRLKGLCHVFNQHFCHFHLILIQFHLRHGFGHGRNFVLVEKSFDNNPLFRRIQHQKFLCGSHHGFCYGNFPLG